MFHSFNVYVMIKKNGNIVYDLFKMLMKNNAFNKFDMEKEWEYYFLYFCMCL